MGARVPEWIAYEGLTDESQPLRDLFLEASSGDGSTSRSALSSACSRNSACNEALRRSVFPCFFAICVSTWVSLARKSSVGAAAERSGTLLLKLKAGPGSTGGGSVASLDMASLPD